MQVRQLNQSDIEFPTANELFHKHRTVVVLKQERDAIIQLVLVGDDAALIQANARVLLGRFNDHRPVDGAIRHRQILDDEELRRRQAGPAQKNLRQVLGARQAERLVRAAGKRNAHPFE